MPSSVSEIVYCDHTAESDGTGPPAWAAMPSWLRPPDGDVVRAGALAAHPAVELGHGLPAAAGYHHLLPEQVGRQPGAPQEG